MKKNLIIIGSIICAFIVLPAVYSAGLNAWTTLAEAQLEKNSAMHNKNTTRIEQLNNEITDLVNENKELEKDSADWRDVLCNHGYDQYCFKSGTGVAVVEAQTDYKKLRMKEMRDIIWSDYNHLFQYNEKLIAHLYTECPVLTIDCGYKEGQARNDHGYAIGLMQHHIVYRSSDWFKKNGFVYKPSDPSYTTTVREKFYADHDWSRDWRSQFTKYLDIQSACLAKNDISHCIRLWNWNAGIGYYNKVQSNVYVVREMML